MLAYGDHSRISVEEYLAGEAESTLKHELIDGEAYAMSGARVNHNRLSGNIFANLHNHLNDAHSTNVSNCEVFASDLKVRVGDNFFYPDVVVDCSDNLSADAVYTATPLLIVEVLSASTRRTDQTIKRDAYTSLPSLEKYVLIEQDIAEIEVLRKNHGWQSRLYYPGDEVYFESVGLSLPVELIYQRVDNLDMRKFIERQGNNE